MSGNKTNDDSVRSEQDDRVKRELDAARAVWSVLAQLDAPGRSRVMAIVKQYVERTALAADVTESSPVDALRFPVALRNCLANAGVESVGDLASKSKRDLFRMRGVGQKFVGLVEDALDAAGMSLREDSTSS